MTYRTILVHLGDADRFEPTLDAAIKLAVTHRAHLIGIHVLPPVRIYAGVEAYVPTEIIESQRNHYKEVSTEIGKTFESAIQKAGLSGEWRVSDVLGRSPASEIISHGRRADLIILPQVDPEENFPGPSSWSEQIMLEAGRPVLFIPYIGATQDIGKSVLVAWNASRESSRAVFDALPILVTAKTVEIMWENLPAGSDGDLILTGAEIATTLARHDVKVATAEGIDRGVDAGNELLSRASDIGADLIVMGGYGHSRFREMILGGVTRLMMQSMTVPVLMSH
jgi:nucleotide-binding universal stress UspA family protein